MPVTGRVKIPLTIENVFSRVSEYEVYKYYLGHDFISNKAVHSPFRKDENPSLVIFVGNNSKMLYFDHADDQFSGDCINFVCQLFSINPSQALAKIDHDLGLGIGTPNSKQKLAELQRVAPIIGDFTEKKPAIIQVVSRRFNTDELKYWNSYHISEKTLKDNDVYAIKTLYLNRRRYPLRSDLCFAYLFMVNGEAKWKIYWPERQKQEKWAVNNVPNTHMSGMEKLQKGDEWVIITKAKKDEMVLSLFLPRVVSVQHEGVYSINDENLKLLEAIPNRVINFDADNTGIKASKYYNQFGYGWINCPVGFKDPKNKNVKDFADLGRYYGLDTVMAYFKKKHIPIHI